MKDLCIKTLGAAEVWLEGQTVQWRAESARELFFYLLSNPRGHSREHIVERLWDMPCDAHTSNRFRVTVHRIRHALGWHNAVIEEHSRYMLAPEVLAASDIEAFAQALQKAEEATTSQKKIRLYQAALNFYTGEYLPEFEADWAAETRAVVQQTFVRAELELACLLDQQGRLEESTLALSCALHTDPYLGENYHQTLIRQLAQTAGKYAAIEHYRRFVHFLRTEVGDTPMPETVELVEQIKHSGPTFLKHSL